MKSLEWKFQFKYQENEILSQARRVYVEAAAFSSQPYKVDYQ